MVMLTAAIKKCPGKVSEQSQQLLPEY